MNEVQIGRDRSPEGTDAANALEPVDADDRGVSSRQYQELWFRLARTHWRTLVLVPADDGGSATEIATSLAQVGRILHESVSVVDFKDVLDSGMFDARTNDSTSPFARPVLRAADRPGKLIAALLPVVSEPLGLTMATAADVVVLCVELGHARRRAVQRTIELVGRERIAGCILIR